MPDYSFDEGVKPGGLTQSNQLVILLCYLLANVESSLSRDEIEAVLLEEELANYFIIADGFAQLEAQKLAKKKNGGYILSEKGGIIAQTLEKDLPLTVREAALKATLRARRYKILAAQNKCTVQNAENGKLVECTVGDDTGMLFKMGVYVPDDASAKLVCEQFAKNGGEVYRLMLDELLKKENI